MKNKIIIANRLNWIDWAKSIAIFFVVFGHIPEQRGSFLINYIVQFHMPLFFFISGYLTKKEGLTLSMLNKYWHTLLIPYLFYNIIFYPYWAVRHTIDFPNAEWFDYIKPIIGTFIFQLKTPFSDLLNGVTWFIAALLFMKILLAISYHYKKNKIWLIFIIVLDAFFYIINEQYRFTTELVLVGLMKCFPFFFIGHYCKQKNIVNEKPQDIDIWICLIGLAISFFSYIFIRKTTFYILYGFLFWTLSLSAIFSILSLCKLLNRFRSTIIDNISIGTIVIMGLHWILIGCINYALSKILHINGGITYSWYVSICLALLYIAILYPIIILFKNKYPSLLGKRILYNKDVQSKINI